jgi:predicted O-methyltransferase YrrM
VKYSVVALGGGNGEVKRPAREAARREHSAWAFLGLRPARAQHTSEEHAAFRRWANGCRTVVEIGVAEGVSALALREGMANDGTIYLIDPFHLSRLPMLNFIKRVAQRTVGEVRRGRAVWIEKFSQDAVREWNEPIDLLLIDGDHSYGGVERDWKDWSRFVRKDGIAMFHDARLFDGGWTTPEYGPVRLVDNIFRSGAAAEWSIVAEIHSLVVVRRNEGGGANPVRDTRTA